MSDSAQTPKKSGLTRLNTVTRQMIADGSVTSASKETMSETERNKITAGFGLQSGLHDVGLILDQRLGNERAKIQEAETTFERAIRAWRRVNHVMRPVLLILVGFAVYAYFEGWGFIDMLYFSMVTCTCVGYGDLLPTTVWSKAFTIVYTLLSIVTIFTSFTELIVWIETKAFLLEKAAEKKVKDMDETHSRHSEKKTGQRHVAGKSRCSCCWTVDTSQIPLSVAPQEVDKLLNYPKRYFWAMMPIFSVVVLGCCLYLLELDGAHEEFPGWGIELINALYFSIITFTTIGYGDLSPQQWHTRLAACALLPLGVMTLASTIQNVSLISLRRRIRNTDLTDGIEHLMSVAMAEDGNDVVTEGDFLVHCLRGYKLVDPGVLTALQRHFAYIDQDSSGFLDPVDVWHRLNAYGKVKDISQLGQFSDPSFRYVDLSAADGGLKEWEARYFVFPEELHLFRDASRDIQKVFGTTHRPTNLDSTNLVDQQISINGKIVGSR